MTARRALAIVAAVVVTGLAVAATFVMWLKLAPRVVPAGQPPLATLGEGSLAGVRETFNAHDDKVRVVVMLSPT